MWKEGIGFIAAILTTAAFIPQAYKIWRTKNAEGVSTTMYIVMLTGVGLWEFYGWMIYSLPVIVSNLITALLLIMILFFKIKNKT